MVIAEPASNARRAGGPSGPPGGDSVFLALPKAACTRSENRVQYAMLAILMGILRLAPRTIAQLASALYV
jgi:hypothetical protein